MTAKLDSVLQEMRNTCDCAHGWADTIAAEVAGMRGGDVEVSYQVWIGEHCITTSKGENAMNSAVKQALILSEERPVKIYKVTSVSTKQEMTFDATQPPEAE